MKSLKLTVRLFIPGFYFITGIIMLLIMMLSNGTLIHVGLLGILSIAVSYGLGRMRRWALYPLIILFLSGITFGVTTIYSSTKLFDQDLVAYSFQAIMILYIILLVISFLDVLSKRQKLE